MPIAKTPEPPYYAVIFTTLRSRDDVGYAEMAEKMFALAESQPGYLGIEIAGQGRHGIGISYWADEASIHAWKRNSEHLAAQHHGRDRWYDSYMLRVAKVERAYNQDR